MTVDARRALAEAYQALLDGPAEPTSMEGAKVNALHSIAWSLMGLLAKDMDAEARETISDAVKRLALIRADK